MEGGGRNLRHKNDEKEISYELILPADEKIARVAKSSHILLRISIPALISIPRQHELSLKPALARFALKINPIASYGISLTWEHLKKNQFELLDRVKLAS